MNRSPAALWSNCKKVKKKGKTEKKRNIKKNLFYNVFLIKVVENVNFRYSIYPSNISCDL